MNSLTIYWADGSRPLVTTPLLNAEQQAKRILARWGTDTDGVVASGVIVGLQGKREA